MSVAAKIAKSKASNIFLVLGQDRGLPCYHYIMVDQSKIAKFSKLGNGETDDITKYGTILESGFGHPTEQVKKKMKEEYNFEE